MIKMHIPRMEGIISLFGSITPNLCNIGTSHSSTLAHVIQCLLLLSVFILIVVIAFHCIVNICKGHTF